jgi:hypothetical protein
MEARFRADYPGEFVILNTTWSGGKRTQQREWIENPIVNQHISGRAICIGSRDSILDDYPRGIDHTILERHRGGLLGSLKLQTYGTGTIAEDMRLDFTVELDSTKLYALKESKYHEDNVIYTSAKNCISNPGEFYLVPQKPNLSLPALPIYIAAFDGHKEIFLLGYSKETFHESNGWMEDVNVIFETYPGVRFWLVGEPTIMPERWLERSNVNTLSYKDFRCYADV